MNWVRGLFRAWLVFGVVWISLVMVAAVGHWPHAPADDWITPEASGAYEGFIKEPKPLTDAQVAASHAEYETHRRRVWSHVGIMTLFALAPPIALFAAGGVLLWVARGFQNA